MSDLRKAAEELIEAWDWDCSEPRNKALRDLIEALRQALAQPEQGNSNSNYPNTKANTSLKHEPWCDSVTKLLLSLPPQIPPCNCKPKREWVGLTDEEIKEISFSLPIKWTGHLQGASSIYDFARAVEAKFKEKNT